MWKFRRAYKLLNFTYSMYLGRTQVAELMTGVRLSRFPENYRDPLTYHAHQTHFLYCTSLDCSRGVAVIEHAGSNECDDDVIDCGNDGCGENEGGVAIIDHGGVAGGNECENDESECGNDGCGENEGGVAIIDHGGGAGGNECDNAEIESGNDGRGENEGGVAIIEHVGGVGGNECDNAEIECGNDGCGEDEGGGLSDEDCEIEPGQSGIKDEKFNQEVGIILEILRGRVCESEEKEICDKPGVVSGTEVAKKLKQCGINPTPELVIEVLTRMRNDWEVAFMFFLWAGKQSGYAHLVRHYHSMISILAKKRKFDTAWTLIDEMRKIGIVSHNTLLIMIRRYSAAHDVTNAINTFHAFKRFDLHIGMEEFHKLLSALTRYKNVQEAEHLLFSNKNTFQFNTKSFNIILNGWCNIVGSPREANRFWRLMIDQGIELDVISYSSIISGYSKFNKVTEVIRLFNKMKDMGLNPDRKVYNVAMFALAKGGRAKEALNLLRTMEEKGIAPNSVTFNSLISPLCKARSRDEAQKVYDEMLRRGLQPTIRTFHAFLRIQRTEEDIFMLLDKMKELGCHPDKDTYLLLIKKFFRWQKLDKVFMFWDQMKDNGWNDDRSSYIALIHGLFLNGKLEEAQNFYLEMKEKLLLPDAKTDELIQSWLSNKQMAESQMINAEPTLAGGGHVPMIGKGPSNKFNKERNPQKQPEFKKVVKERGFSFWE